MNATTISVPAAFVAGLISFFSPCILPLVPVYLGYMTGSAVSSFSQRTRLSALAHSAFFVLGFGLVFVLLGAAAGLVGSLIYPLLPYVIKVGGVVLVVFGLHLTGLITVPFLSMEKRLDVETGRKGFGSSFLVGVVFAAGWTPCVGPVLAAILLLATSTQTVVAGALLLLVYALGLGVPFLIVAALVDIATPALRRLNRHLRVVSIIGGVLLIVMGLMLITGLFDAFVFRLNAIGAGW